MKRIVVLLAGLNFALLLHPISATASPVSEELPLFAPNATQVDRLTDWRVRGFILLTVARINLHDPTVVQEFGPNGIFMFGGWGLPEEAQAFLAHALPMHLYPDTIKVMRSEGDLVAQLTYSGFTYKSAISTYLWRLESRGLSYTVESANYISLAAPTTLRVSPVIEVGIDFGDVTISDRMFSDTQVFQFNFTNNIPDGSLPGNQIPLVSIYRADNPNVVMLDAQRQIGRGLNRKTMGAPGFAYIGSLTAPPLSEGYRALQLVPGTYIVLRMTKVGDQMKVDQNPANVLLFVVK